MAPPSFLSWITGSHGRQQPLGEDGIDQALGQLCRFPVPTQENPRPRIAANTFVRISTLLEPLDHHAKFRGWHKRPRIYTLLRLINRLDTMPAFVSEGLFDLQLPFDYNHLPTSLGAYKDNFCQYQDRVCTDAKYLEEGDRGRHLSLISSGDNHFPRRNFLGSGGFGEVDEVWSRLSLRFYARKKFLRRGINKLQAKQLFDSYSREISALKRLKHRHLVRIVGTYTDPTCFAFLMEPVAEHNLKEFLDQASKNIMLMRLLRSFFGCLAKTIAYLHSEKINHMDLKLGNILVSGGQIRVTDFGTAHDWSLAGISTTHTPAPHTDFYIPPELGRDPRASRNSKTDMWSLGVVFLEMVSVLRGQTCRKFRDHLQRTSTGRVAVFNNLRATYKWFKVLQACANGDDSDNEPLMWVKDLIAEQPHNRPSASDLHLQILRSPTAEQWRQSCCSEPDGTLHEIITETEDSDLTWASSHFPNPHIAVSESHMQPSYADLTVLDWQSQIENTTRSIPGAWTDEEVGHIDKALPHDTTNDETVVAPGLHGPQIHATVGSTLTEIPWNVVDDCTGLSAAFNDSTANDTFAQKLNEFELFDSQSASYTQQPVSPQSPHDQDEEQMYEIELDNSVSDESIYTVRPLSDITELEDENLLKPPTQTIPLSVARTQQDANESSRLRPLLRINELVDDSPRFPAQAIPQDAPDTSRFTSQRSNLRPLSNINDVEDEDLPRGSVQSVSRDLPVTERTSSESVRVRPRDSSLPDYVPFVDDEALAQENITGLTQTSKKETLVVQPASLTAGNLDAHTRQESSTRTVESHRFDIELENPRVDLPPDVFPSASAYIKEVYRAESEAPTSVVSAKTKSSLGAPHLTRWLDHDQNFLGQFSRQGNVGAVRECLKRGCNPGTFLKRRPGPLLSAVSGRSENHNKCARVLLQYGANPNVDRRGKPALHIAIEHECFKGYGNLIIMLLESGADPDAIDTSGDTAVHKILLGGYGRLPKHKRDALALLMHFHASVDIAPKGTKQKPIHLAVRRNDPWAVSFMLEKGANVSEQDGASQTPLAIAAGSWARKISEDQRNTLQQLIKYKANVSEPFGFLKSTALHVAVAFDDEIAATILIRHRADIGVRDARGRRPLDLIPELVQSKKIPKEREAFWQNLLQRRT